MLTALLLATLLAGFLLPALLLLTGLLLATLLLDALLLLAALLLVRILILIHGLSFQSWLSLDPEILQRLVAHLCSAELPPRVRAEPGCGCAVPPFTINHRD